MGLFSKPEVIILKEDSDAKLYLEKLEELLPKTSGALQKQVQKEIAITKAGIAGEDNILFELKNSNMDMIVLHDIYIETKDGLGAQIDFVVVTPKITFLIECKNLFGNIEIDAKGNFIRTMEFGRNKHKEGIYSPITQSERHMTVLKECIVEDKNILLAATVRLTFDKFYKSLVVLANSKMVMNDKYAKKEIKEQVLRSDQMIQVLKKMNSDSKELASSKKDMLAIAEKLLRRNKEVRKDYFAKYQELLDQLELDAVIDEPQCETIEESVQLEKKEQVKEEQEKAENEKETMLCPKCKSELVLRTAKKGANAGQQFYGCSNYPKCGFILNLSTNASD